MQSQQECTIKEPGTSKLRFFFWMEFFKVSITKN
jgi:hypothetical protein